MLNDKIISMYNKIRDIPYSISNSPEAFSCKYKNFLLKKTFENNNIECKICLCKFSWKDQPELVNTVYRDKLINITRNIDFVNLHTFLKIKINNTWKYTDITWDCKLEKCGFKINYLENEEFSLAVKAIGDIIEFDNEKEYLNFKEEFFNKNKNENLDYVIYKLVYDEFVIEINDFLNEVRKGVEI